MWASANPSDFILYVLSLPFHSVFCNHTGLFADLHIIRKHVATSEPLLLLCPRPRKTLPEIATPFLPLGFCSSISFPDHPVKLHHHPLSTYFDLVPDFLLYIYLIIVCFPLYEGSSGGQEFILFSDVLPGPDK